MTTNTVQLSLFLDISAWLTGFEAVQLQGTGMAQTYYDTLTGNSSAAAVAAFAQEARAVVALGAKDAGAAQARIQAGLMDTGYNDMAKKIILMWYTGQWYPDPVNDLFTSNQINAQSYIEGLMWPAAQTHPPGAKQPGFASWAEQPVDINLIYSTSQG